MDTQTLVTLGEMVFNAYASGDLKEFVELNPTTKDIASEWETKIQQLLGSEDFFAIVGEIVSTM